jgi:hypothetical protein
MGKCSLMLSFILALVSRSFMTQSPYPWGKRLRFSFNRRLGGTVGF